MFVDTALQQLFHLQFSITVLIQIPIKDGLNLFAGILPAARYGIRQSVEDDRPQIRVIAA